MRVTALSVSSLAPWFSCPAIIYHCDLTKEPLQPHVFREVTVKGFDPSEYQTTQVSTDRLSDLHLHCVFYTILHSSRVLLAEPRLTKS
jgi:hypothetical protein